MKKLKRITFILPGIPYGPCGGHKIVYEYANRLVKRGYEVNVLFMCKTTFVKHHIPEILRRMLCRYIVKNHPKWFHINNLVKKRAIFEIDDSTIPNADSVFATSANTAFPVFNLGNEKGKKYYLIQDQENWAITEGELIKTYSLMHNIAISKWLKEYVDRNSPSDTDLISNSIDTSVFFMEVPPEKRSPFSIAALYHEKPIKGFIYTWEVIERLKAEFPQLEVRIFGASKKPEKFPDWVEYTENANEQELRKIYNASAVFICSSVHEGYGLTCTESMACGCALAVTDFLGSREYALDQYNALVSPVKDVEKMYQNVKKIMLDQTLRVQIALHGMNTMKNMSWDLAVDKMETILKVD